MAWKRAVRSSPICQAAYLKANVAHWHGAAANVPVVQATMYGGTLQWLDPVTDEEYSGKKKR